MMLYKMFFYLITYLKPIFTDRVSGRGNAIGRFRLSVRLSVHSFPLYLLNELTFDLLTFDPVYGS